MVRRRRTIEMVAAFVMAAAIEPRPVFVKLLAVPGDTRLR
jgi:hypothetical protein